MKQQQQPSSATGTPVDPRSMSEGDARKYLPSRYLFQSVKSTVVWVLLLSVGFSLSLGLVFEFALNPGTEIDGVRETPLETHGSTGFLDVGSDGRADLLLGARPASGHPPVLLLRRATDSGYAPPVQLLLPGSRALPSVIRAGPLSGPGWLFALSMSDESTPPLLTAFRVLPGTSPPSLAWSAGLNVPAWSPPFGFLHLLSACLSQDQQTYWLEARAGTGEHVLICLRPDEGSASLRLLTVPAGYRLSGERSLLGPDGVERLLLSETGLEDVSPDGPHTGESALLDPRDGALHKLPWGKGSTVRSRVLPDRRHVLVISREALPLLSGPAAGALLWDTWEDRVVREWPQEGVLDSWELPGGDGPAASRLLIVTAADLRELNPAGGGSRRVRRLGRGQEFDRVEQGWLLGGLRAGQAWLIHTTDGRRIELDFHGVGELLLLESGDGPLELFIRTQDQLQPVRLTPRSWWARLLSQPATGWGAGFGGVLMMVAMVFLHQRKGMMLLNILEDDSTSVALLDGEGKLLFANRGFQDLLKLVGNEQLMSVLREKDTAEGTTRLLDQHWIRLHSRPLRKGHREQGRLVFGMDETAQREASEGRSFRSLTGLITHELKTPMTPLRLGLDQIQREVERIQKPIPESLDRVLTRMRADLENMSRRLRQFMSLAGERRPPELLDLRQPLEFALQRSNLLQLPFVRCELRLPDVPAWVEGDPEMLTMVLTGILANSLEAMSHRGQLRIHLWQESVRHDASHWLLTIEDDGHGISQEYRDHMWEPGYSTGKDGYGYGLFFARNIIQDMQGQILLEDGDVGGTLVRIILPAREARPLPSPTGDVPPKEEPNP